MSITLRPARGEDAVRLWQLRNEAGMRAASFDGAEVSLDSHRVWFTALLADDSRWLFVAEDPAGATVGFVRFDAVGSLAEISVTIDAAHRGRGVGTEVLRSAVAALSSLRPDLIPVALVKPDNAASLRAFTRAGFGVVGERDVAGHPAIELRLAKAGTK